MNVSFKFFFRPLPSECTMLFAIGQQSPISPPTEGSAKCTVARRADVRTQEMARVDYRIT